MENHTSNKKDDDDRPELNLPIPSDSNPQQDPAMNLQKIVVPSQSNLTQCQFCHHKGEMLIEYQNSALGVILAILILLIAGFMAIFFFPFIVFLTRNKVQRCPRCMNRIRVSFLLSLFPGGGKLSDQVLSFNIGSFGIVLTRKYLIYLILLMSALLATFLLLQNGAFDYDEARPIDYSITWQKYNEECGRQQAALNYRKANKIYVSNYYNKGVNWDGQQLASSSTIQVICRVFNLKETIFGHTHDKQDPNNFQKQINSQTPLKGQSIVVSLSSFYFRKYEGLLDKLKIGDRLSFKATLISMANQNYIHHLHGFELKQLNQNRHVVKHIHQNNSRYQYSHSKQLTE